MLPEVHGDERHLALRRGQGFVLLGLVPLALEERLAQRGEEPAADVGAHAQPRRGQLLVLVLARQGRHQGPVLVASLYAPEQLVHLVLERIVCCPKLSALFRFLFLLLFPPLLVVVDGTRKVKTNVCGDGIARALQGGQVFAFPDDGKQVGQELEEGGGGARPAVLGGGCGGPSHATGRLISRVVVIVCKELFQLFYLFALLLLWIFLLPIFCRFFLGLLTLLFFLLLLPLLLRFSRIGRGVMVFTRHGLAASKQRRHIDHLNLHT
mmetsp:Transcript_99458/g.281702  ORF Transcript_99458/g.281702 Transcript_99458/m.281702 type:complete len:266 (+) Transcript_99458:170-967(+)